MPITVRYAQEVPDAIQGKDGKDGTVGKDGLKGKAGAAGAAGQDLTPKGVLIITTNGEQVDVDLDLYSVARVTATAPFNINFFNGFDGNHFRLHIINNSSTPPSAVPPGFMQGITWPNGGTQPSWTTTYGFRDIIIIEEEMLDPASGVVDHLWPLAYATDYGLLV